MEILMRERESVRRQQPYPPPSLQHRESISDVTLINSRLRRRNEQPFRRRWNVHLINYVAGSRCYKLAVFADGDTARKASRPSRAIGDKRQ